MKSFLSVFILSVILSVCSGIFQEQLGEYDWKKENIGFIDKSVQFHDKLFVATSEDVVSSINVKDGGINWRALYPKSSSFQQMMVVNDCVVVLSTQKTQHDFSTSLLRGWSITDGSLMWDLSLGAATSSDSTHSDLMFDTNSNLLVVLFRNSLYFVTPPLNSRASSNVDVWFWSPESSAESGMWTLSSLIVPTTFVDKTKSSAASSSYVARVAVGCLSVSSSCDKTGVFKINKNTKSVTVDEFTGIPHIAGATQLRGTVSSDDRFGYSHEDVLFAVSNNDHAGSAVSVVTLSAEASATVNTLPIAVPEGSQLADVPSIFVFATLEGEIKPAVTACFVVKDEEVPQQQCAAYVVAGGAPLVPLVDAAACGGTQAQLLSEPASYYRGLTSVFDCVAVQWSETNSLLESLSFASSGGLVTDKQLSLNIVHPTPSVLNSGSTAAAFRHVIVTRATTDANSGAKSSVVVLVLHSGLTVGISISSNSNTGKSATGGVIWSRDEALTHMRWVELVDVDKKTTAGAAGAGDSVVEKMPSVVERLVMQKEDAVDYVKGLVASAQSLQSLATHHVNKLLGKNQGELVARDIDKMKLFGFDKVAVSLCFSTPLEAFLNGESSTGVRFSEAGFKIVALNMLHGNNGNDAADIKWTAFPSLTGVSVTADPVVTFVRLLSSSHSNSRVARSVYLIVGTADGDTLMWSFDASSGKSSIKEHRTAAKAADSTFVVPVAAAMKGEVVKSVSVRSLSGADNSHFKATHSILHESVDGDHSTLSVTHIGTNKQSGDSAAGSSEFVHYVDRATGTVRIYKLNGNSCTGIHKPEGALAGKLFCHQADAVASAVFPTEFETIVDVAYRNSHDVVNSRSSILGDDSVLLKYLNPNVALITTISPPAAAASEYSAGASASSASGDGDSADATAAAVPSAADSELSLTLVDTVTGKIIKRITLDSAVRPVHNVFVENTIVTTYWNNKAKRTELSCIALYEGVIDKYDMGPFASSKTKANPPHYHAATYSAYSTIAPMAMQKTYTLPTAVTALQHTLTANGISNKNILVGLRNGQVMSVDMRMIHPRRPMSEPSQSEKEEGLMKYNPFLVFNTQMSSLTYNYALLGHGVSHIVSAPSRLESSSLVLSFGGNSVDIHLNRALPSQGFDMLASDFNYSLLVTILVGLGLVVVVLRRMHQKKLQSTLWA